MDAGPGDARCPGAAVGLEDIAVDLDRVLPEGHRPHRGPQRTPDQALDLLAAAAWAVALAAVAFGFAWLADRPGEIVLTWQGQRIETSLMIAIGAIALLTIAIMITWSILRFVFRIPTLMSLTARARP